MQNLTTDTGKSINTSQKPIASGGEGSIYKITTTSHQQYVAKIYHDKTKAKASEQKIKYMVKNSPITNCSVAIQNAIVWPAGTLHKKGQFVGYFMPYLQMNVSLKLLTQTKLSNQLKSADWTKFDHSTPNSRLNRFKICYNLAQAIHVLHCSDKYVLVDLKPENIMIDSKGQIAIIDLDSIQIAENGKVIYPAVAFTEDYAPPEMHHKKVNPKTDLINKNWDYFSFSVIIYSLLFGLHPFAASHKKYTQIQELIKHGLFPHGSKRNMLHTIPVLHNEFTTIPKSIQDGFFETFETGNTSPNKRTAILDWASLFITEINKGFGQNQCNNTITANRKHQKRKPGKIPAGKKYPAGSPYANINKPIRTGQIYQTRYPIGNITPPVKKKRKKRKYKPRLINYFNYTINNYVVEIKWITSQATHVFLNNKQVKSSGTLIVPFQHSSYTLKVYGPHGTSTKTLNILIPANHQYNNRYLFAANIPLKGLIQQNQHPVAIKPTVAANNGMNLNKTSLHVNTVKTLTAKTKDLNENGLNLKETLSMNNSGIKLKL
jgi:serine/threonine protein kinase